MRHTGRLLCHTGRLRDAILCHGAIGKTVIHAVDFLADLEAADLAEALGLVSTVFGAAKDALGRRYVSLATHTRAPSLDLRALFAGTDGV